MQSKITYTRRGLKHSVNIETRLVPNPIAVKFVVLEHELGHNKDLVPSDDHLLLDDLLKQMEIEILDVSRIPASGSPKPYTHRM